MTELTKDNISRIAAAFLEKDPTLFEKYGEQAFEIIGASLQKLKLEISCGEEIKSSVCLQAALITAINVGKRCYKGGVFIEIPDNTPCLLAWPDKSSFNKIAKEVGAQTLKENSTIKVHLGCSNDQSKWRIIANNWVGVVVPPGIECPNLIDQKEFPLGGIAAGALIVALTFLKVTGFDYTIGSETVGLSLWRPDLHWSADLATGHSPKTIPSDIWLLGAGHLGQAYSWVMGLLTFDNPQQMKFKLQDDDKIVRGNYDSGILAEYKHENHYKTRILSAWLEARGFQTRIVERKYDKFYNKQVEDPSILLSGLDNIETRRILRSSEFQLLLDCGLGSGLDFDLIRMHAFPNNALSPEAVWLTKNNFEQNPRLKMWTSQYTKCGFTVGISSAFTGCLAACITVSELLRSCNQGIKLSHTYITLRELANRTISTCGFYGTEIMTPLASLK